MSDFIISGNTPDNGWYESGTSGGVGVYGVTTANTKGSWTEVAVSLVNDTVGLGIGLIFSNTLNTYDDILVDIAIGASGSEQVLIENIQLSGAAISNFAAMTHVVFPIALPAGTRLAARFQHSTTSVATPIVEVSIQTFLSTFQGVQGYSGVLTMGANTADSGGTSIDPGNTANTDGAWTEITASCTEDVYWLVAKIGNQRNNVRSTAKLLLDIGVGASGSEQVIVSNFPLAISANIDGVLPNSFSFPCRINANSRVAVRARCSITDATDRLFDIVLYGVY